MLTLFGKTRSEPYLLRSVNVVSSLALSYGPPFVDDLRGALTVRCLFENYNLECNVPYNVQESKSQSMQTVMGTCPAGAARSQKERACDGSI